MWRLTLTDDVLHHHGQRNIQKWRVRAPMDSRLPRLGSNMDIQYSIALKRGYAHGRTRARICGRTESRCRENPIQGVLDVHIARLTNTLNSDASI